MELICSHQDSNQTCLDEGVRLLELAQKASQLFIKQPAAEKCRLLGFVRSNCTWKDGRLTAEYRQPFDLLAKNMISLKAKKPAEHAQTGLSDIWLPDPDSNQGQID
jgi:site-specific DNA recombinase